MQFINYLLLFWVNNLYNSFNIGIIYYRHNQIYKHKINMGCDYYINKELHIYDNNNIPFTFITLTEEGC